MAFDPNYVNAFRGISLPEIDAARRQNALGNLDLQMEQQKVAGAMNPDATPEQLARSGNVDIANAVTNQQQMRQQNAARYAGMRLATVRGVEDMKKLAADPNFGSAMEAVGAPHPSQVDNFSGVTDEQIRSQASTLARALGVQTPPATEGFTLGAGQTRFDANGRPVASAGPESDVSWHDAGDKLIPVLKNGQPAPGIAPIPKQTPPGQQYTQDSVENTAQMIYRGQMPMVSGFALKSPWGQQVLKRVGELSNQGEAAGGDAYSAGTFPQRVKALRDFNTGAQGNSVRFMNVAISHIGVLEQLGKELDNGNVQAINRFKNAWKTQTGESIPTSFNAARDIVANEVVKAVTASGGGVADRQEAQAQISSASSWKQIADVAATWKSLLAGQLGGLRLQYENATGLKDFDKKLYPETLRELGGLDTTQQGAAPAPTNAKGWTLHQDAQGNKAYVSPDGTQFEEVR